MVASIYQISLTPIAKEQWIKEDDFYDTLLYEQISTYIQIENDRTGSIRKLRLWLEKSELGSVSDDQIVFHPDLWKSAYFSNQLEDFQNAAMVLSQTDMKQYFSDTDSILDMLWETEKYLINRYSDYIYLEAGYVIPMDSFLRSAEPGKPYYIGGVCKYRF